MARRESRPMEACSFHIAQTEAGRRTEARVRISVSYTHLDVYKRQGKSTLVREVFYRALMRKLGEADEAPGTHRDLSGDIESVKAVEFVDQNPIGVSSRSNPATYLKAYDEIRRLFADQQLSKQMGFSPTFFSFNSDGGRCEECKGEGLSLIHI